MFGSGTGCVEHTRCLNTSSVCCSRRRIRNSLSVHMSVATVEIEIKSLHDDDDDDNEEMLHCLFTCAFAH